MLPSLLEIERYIKVHFDECAKYYVVTILSFLVGFAAGFFTKVNLTTVSQNTYILITFSKAFACFFEVVLALAIINILCFFYYTAPLAVVVLIVRGMAIVRHFVIICTLFGASGVVFVVFFYAPFHIIFSAVLIVSATGGLKRGLSCRYTKKPFVSSLREVAVFFSAATLVLLVFCIIFSALYIRIVVLL